MLSKLQIKRPSVGLDEGKATELADIFRLLSDSTRLRIVLSCMGEPVCVGDIAGQLGLSSSLVSHHFRLLRAGRLVRAKRRGKQVFYSVADEQIRCVLDDMVDHVLQPLDDSEGA
jgi:ArsR family transcriptional regulator, lead/cadmium/zinc/bismuth-responsive transcriptional repressor